MTLFFGTAEYTETTGTGTYTLKPLPNALSFSARLADGQTVVYNVTDGAGTWERTRGVWNETAKTLTRATVIFPGAAISWAAGRKFVILDNTSALSFSDINGLAVPSQGGTGVANNDANTITVAGDLITTGAGALTLGGNVGTTVANFPSGTHTVAGLDVAQTFTAVQQFDNDKLLLKGSTSGSLKLNAPAVAGTNTVTFPAGTTDFSSTGGTDQVVKQNSSGGPLTVGTITGVGTITTGTWNAGTVTTTTPGSSLADQIYDLDRTNTTQLDKTNTTLANITGIAVIALVAGKTYNIRGWISVSAPAAGGLKLAFVAAGGLTTTSQRINAMVWNGTTIISNTTIATNLNDNLVANTAVITDVFIEGSLVVNAAGSIRLQAAQNAASGTTSILIGSTLSFRRVN